MDTTTMIHKQARSRKTIDLGLLKQFVLDKANRINKNASFGSLSQHGYGFENGNYHIAGQPSAIALANSILEDFMHLLDCYGGFNTRMWHAFTSLSRSYDIVRQLVAYDHEHDTNHYGKLVKRLDYGYHRECKAYYGKVGDHIGPTKDELARAQYIHDKYVKVLGL